MPSLVLSDMVMACAVEPVPPFTVNVAHTCVLPLLPENVTISGTAIVPANNVIAL